MTLWLAIALGFSMTAPGAAQQAPGSAESNASTTAARSADEPRVCRTIHATESRLRGQRLCMTRAEWRRYDRGQ